MKTYQITTYLGLALLLTLSVKAGLITDTPSSESSTSLSQEDFFIPELDVPAAPSAVQLFEQTSSDQAPGDKQSTDLLASRKVKSALDAAEAARRKGDWEQGLAELKKGLMIEPDNLQLIGHAAAFASLAKRYEEADQLFQRFLRDRPRNSGFLVGRADILLRLGRKDDASEVIEQARLINSNSLAVNFSLLAIQIAQGQTPEKAHQWDLIDDPKVLANLVGWIASDRDDLETVMGPEGLQLFCDQVIGPGSAKHLAAIRDAAMELRTSQATLDTTGSIKALDTLKKLGIRKPLMEMNIAIDVFDSGSREEALSIAQEAIAVAPRLGNLRFNEGLMLLRMQRYAEAERAFELALQKDKQDGPSAFGLACALAEQGLKYKAWEILQPLAESHSVQMLTWIDGSAPYLHALQTDPWYEPVRKQIGFKTPSVSN